MDVRAIQRSRAWTSLRSIPRWKLVAGCAAAQVAVLLAAIVQFVMPPLIDLENHRQRRATGELIAEDARKQREKIISLRTELDRYGPQLNSQQPGVTVDDGDGSMNLLFKQLSRLAGEAGVSIRSFERAGQGFNFDGFAQVSFDTNFLQMTAFMSALSHASGPVHVAEFSARQASDSSDKISFSLTISLAALQGPRAPTCLP